MVLLPSQRYFSRRHPDVGLGQATTVNGIPATRRRRWYQSSVLTSALIFATVIGVANYAWSHRKDIKELLSSTRTYETEYQAALERNNWSSPYNKTLETAVDPLRYRIFVDCEILKKIVTSEHKSVQRRKELERQARTLEGRTGKEFYECRNQRTNPTFIVRTRPLTSSSAPSSSL